MPISLEQLVALDDRDFARLLAAIGRARLAEIFASIVEIEPEPEPEDEMMKKLAEEYRASGGFKGVPKKAEKTPEWMERLNRDDKGRLLPGVVNGMIALRECPELSGLFAFDAGLMKVVIKSRLPDDWTPGFGEVRVMDESSLLSVYEYLLRHGLRLTREEMRSAIIKVAKENPMVA